jgi:hypothetical protein
MRQACASEGFYKENEGKRYCVLHYPGNEKAADFQTALHKKQSSHDYNFSGVWFPKGVRFKEPHWDRNTDFSSATFNEDIDFSGVTFNVKALFNNASFNAGVDFTRVIFSVDADFSSATFNEDIHFNYASFGGNAKFSSASFRANAVFNYASFSAFANFRSASFSAFASFNAASFSAFADFSSASFSALADFSSASFSAFAYFTSASFSTFADFTSASFSAFAVFNAASFSANAYFNAASFNAVADFRSASFSAGADFSEATFKGYFYFAGEPKKRAYGDQQQLNFQFTHFEKPDRVSFHTLDLKPHWFVNIDSRKFEFIDVEFRFDLNEELKSLNIAGVRSPHRLLAIACRQLADNAEANHRYQEASRLRHSDIESRRKERFYGFVPWRLDWWYWLASGYGERVLQAFIVFVVLIGLFTIGYKNADFDPTSKTAITKPMPATASSSPNIPDTQSRRLGWRESALYSFNVSILQKPEPKPMGLWSNALVSLETVLGPAQAALLALALRRRFMR